MLARASGILSERSEHQSAERNTSLRVAFEGIPEAEQAGLAAALKAQGVPTAIYYPKSIHQQTAYRHFPVADDDLPISEALSADVISLPMHAYLDEATQDRIIAAVHGAISA